MSTIQAARADKAPAVAGTSNEAARQADEVFDVIVLGSGAAGLTAAVVCASEKMRVLLLEKTEYVGGTSAISGGAAWLPNSHHAKAVERPDSNEEVIRYVKQFLGNRIDTGMIEAFLDHAPKVVDYLEKHTDVKFQARAFSPDYRPSLPGAAIGGRVLDPLEFDGRKLGERLADLRPPLPEYTAFNSMMVSRADASALLGAHKSLSNLAHSARLVLRFLSDKVRYGRGTRLLLGNALVGWLFKSALDLGVDVRTKVEAKELLRDADGVGGLVCRHDGKTLRIAARAGVVLATGGFPGNREMKATRVPFADQHLSVPPPANDGGGLRLAESAGGWMREDGVNNFFFSPVSTTTRADGSQAFFPHLVLDRQKPGLIAVNKEGRRFVNEAVSYHDFVESMQREGAVPAYLICDSRFIRRYGLGLIHPGPRLLGGYERSGYLVRSATLRGLAEKLAIDAGNLEATVVRNNSFARTGIDEDFGRGGDLYNRFLGDPDNKPNPCIASIEKAPFYAVKIHPGDIGSAAGIAVDVSGQVVDKDGAPVGGLYACGNDMNSIFAGTYPGPGITLGPAIAFGYAAAMSLRDRARREQIGQPETPPKGRR